MSEFIAHNELPFLLHHTHKCTGSSVYANINGVWWKTWMKKGVPGNNR